MDSESVISGFKKTIKDLEAVNKEHVARVEELEGKVLQLEGEVLQCGEIIKELKENSNEEIDGRMLETNGARERLLKRERFNYKKKINLSEDGFFKEFMNYTNLLKEVMSKRILYNSKMYLSEEMSKKLFEDISYEKLFEDFCNEVKRLSEEAFLKSDEMIKLILVAGKQDELMDEFKKKAAAELTNEKARSSFAEADLKRTFTERSNNLKKCLMKDFTTFCSIGKSQIGKHFEQQSTGVVIQSNGFQGSSQQVGQVGQVGQVSHPTISSQNWQPIQQRGQQPCQNCQIRNSLKWRPGPNGQMTLCDECGRNYSKSKVSFTKSLKRKMENDGTNNTAGMFLRRK